MGARGPVGKRDDERVRRNVNENPTATVTAIGVVKIPELGDISFDGETHPLVEDMYESIRQSAAVQFYEPTDWQFARLTLYTLNQELIAKQRENKPLGAMKLTALNQMFSALLLTEGDRRRVRLEIERAPASGPTGENAEVTDMLKKRLGIAS